MNTEEIDLFENITVEQKSLLLKAPAVFSLVAAIKDGIVEEKEKEKAIELSEIKTYSAPKELTSYFDEIAQNFENQFDALTNEYLPVTDTSKAELVEKVKEINTILDQMDSRAATLLKDSLSSYTRYVSKSSQNFLEYFILPLNIPGVTNN